MNIRDQVGAMDEQFGQGRMKKRQAFLKALAAGRREFPEVFRHEVITWWICAGSVLLNIVLAALLIGGAR